MKLKLSVFIPSNDYWEEALISEGENEYSTFCKRGKITIIISQNEDKRPYGE